MISAFAIKSVVSSLRSLISVYIASSTRAVVAVLCQADKLIILSDIDGFFDKDPRLFKDAKLISRIEAIDDSVYMLAGGAGSRRGTGGMRTKLQAADLATAQGIDTIVTNGKNPEVLYKIVAGESAGTLFKGHR